MDRQRMDIKQAAQILNLTTDAVHKRVKRGTLESVKDEDGRLYVFLDDVRNTPDPKDDLIERLESEVEYLRDEAREWKEESRRKDTILLTMAQRIPELEAAPEATESVVTDADGESRGAVPPETDKRSWWRRIFE
jgi:hypothetical protein